MNIKFFNKTNTPKVKKSPLREWVDAIVFAVVAATIIRWVLIEAFTIPTPSMEKSLLVGDFLFVSKFHYGARTPKTPLQVPLTHQKIWGTDIPSYVDWIQLPQFRLPGISEVKNNDVVVFNYPPEEEHPTDLKTNYIKRCIGIPNDVIEIIDMQAHINGKPVENPTKMQSEYYVIAKEVINERVFKKLDITDYRADHSAQNGYVVQTTPTTAEELKKLEFIKEVILLKDEKGRGSEQVFPYSKLYNWNMDNFGALKIPGEGMKIPINEKTLPLYETVILKYEGNEGAEVKNKKLYIDGNEVAEYTFKQNYYFMMGDNRHNSQDSRIWGFVPEDHVLGKALLVWWSIEPEGGLGNLFKRVRWERIGNIIR